jgi:alpha-mannosidase
MHPPHVIAEPNAEVPLRLTVSSDTTDAALHGTVHVTCPDGWTAAPAAVPFELAPGECVDVDVTLTMPSDPPAGLYPVRAQLAIAGRAGPPAWRQVVEDVCTVAVGTPVGEVLRLVSGPMPVDVKAGETARLAVIVGTGARADLAVEAHLISPWGTWEWMGPAAVGAVLPERGAIELGFDVTPPPWVDPGQWWALVRIACAGRLIYTPAVKVTVQ